METPNYNHLTKDDFENVYEPAEDTFLLLDAIESDLPYIEEVLKPTVCLEIGSGSGLIITALSKRLSSTALCLSTDINQLACAITKKTAINNSTSVDAVNANLASCFKNNLFDLILFNPPYVVTSEEESANNAKDSLIFTWAGGKDGRSVIDIFIKNLQFMLASKGIAYLLLLKENKPLDIIEKLNEKNFRASKLMERRIIGEHLFIIKIENLN